ncbi:MAG TPA: YifB family Mg chelatase-like AAA ATPase [Longimicrobiales bacterium]
MGLPARACDLRDMLARALSSAVIGIDAVVVEVEVDLAKGLPSISVVGLPEGAVREGRERVLAALHNSGFELPPRRITINLAPADLRKEGSAFDLPIAVGILAAGELVPSALLADTCFVGELGLDGDLRPVRGVLPIVLRARKAGLRRVIVPQANAAEAAVVDDIEIVPAARLSDVVSVLRGAEHTRAHADVAAVLAATTAVCDVDYADVKGQEHARRALEIAAAGQHNVLLIGPPGAGKSMLARRLPSILPPLTRHEALELTKVHSVAGRLRANQSLVTARPFRAPHHTISDAGLVGGGSSPRPGEASLAHTGVLFLDELPEFRRHVLDALRQPIEDGHIVIGRARSSIVYPARFMLAAAMNPCPCGYYGDGRGRCTCHSAQVQRYMNRVSGPILDRIDLHIEVPTLNARDLTRMEPGEPSAAMRERVLLARDRQLQRFAERSQLTANAHMGARDVRELCVIDDASSILLRKAIQKLGLSARAYHRILKLSRTIADLAGRDRIASAHIAEAIQYRSLDRVPVSP